MSRSRSQRNKHRVLRLESLERRMLLDAAWQNPARPLDVNNDGQATPIDVLVIINRLNSQTESQPLPVRGQSLEPYYDPNGDGFSTPLDALRIINALNESNGQEIYSTARVEGGSEPAPAGFSSLVLGTLPGSQLQLIELSTAVTQGTPRFNELGLFVVEDNRGTVNGLTPDDPEYAVAVFKQPQRKVLYSRLDTFKTESAVEFPGEQLLGVYILQPTTSSPDSQLKLVGEAGNFELQGAAIGWHDTLIEVLKPLIVNSPPIMAPIGDQTVTVVQDRIEIELAANDPDQDPIEFAARATVKNPLAEIRDAYGLQFGGQHLTDLAGLGEKWLIGNDNAKFFILPNGDLIRWQDSFAQTADTESLIARLDPSVYDNPSLLWDAPAEIEAPATVLIEGGRLLVDPFDGVFGEMTVRIAASDGIQFDSQEFAVTVHPEQESYEEQRALVTRLIERAQTLSHEQIPGFMSELGAVVASLDGLQAAKLNDLLRRLDRLYRDTEAQLQAAQEWETQQQSLLARDLETIEFIELELARLQEEYATAWADIRDNINNVQPVDPISIPPIFIQGGSPRVYEIELGHQIEVDASAIHPFGIPEYSLDYVAGPTPFLLGAALNSETGIFTWRPEGDVSPGDYKFIVQARAQIVSKENDFPGVSFPSEGQWVDSEVEFTIKVRPAVAPTLDTVASSPSVITDSGTDVIVVTALGVSHPTERVDFVRFWQDLNGNETFEYGIDNHLGFDSNGQNGWSVMATPLVVPGATSVRILAQAERLAGVSEPVAVSVPLIPSMQLPENLVVRLGQDNSVNFGSTSTGSPQQAYFNGDDYALIFQQGDRLFAQWFGGSLQTGITTDSEPVLLFDGANALRTFDVDADSNGNIVVVAAFHEAEWDEVRAVFAAKPAHRFDQNSFVREFVSSALEQYLPLEDANGNPLLDEFGDPLYSDIPTPRGGNFQVAAEINDAGVGFVTWDYDIPWQDSNHGASIYISGPYGNLIPFQWVLDNGQNQVRTNQGSLIHGQLLSTNWEVASSFGPHSLTSLSDNGNTVLLWPSETGPSHIATGRVLPGPGSNQPQVTGFNSVVPIDLNLSNTPTHIAVADNGWMAIGSNDHFVLISPSKVQVGRPISVTNPLSQDTSAQIGRMEFDSDGSLIVDYRRGFGSFIHERYRFELNTNDEVFLQQVERVDQTDLHAGDSVGIKFTLRNETSNPESNLQVAFYLSHDDQLNPDTITYPGGTVPADRLIGYHDIASIPASSVETYTATVTIPENLDPFWSVRSTDLKLFAAVVNNGSAMSIEVPFVVANFDFQAPNNTRGAGGQNSSSPIYIRPDIAKSQVSNPQIINALDTMELIGRQMAAAIRGLEIQAPAALRSKLLAMRQEVELSIDTYFQQKWNDVVAARNRAQGLAEQQLAAEKALAMSRFEQQKAEQEQLRDQIIAPKQAELDEQNRVREQEEAEANATRDAVVERENRKIAAAQAALQSHLQSENGMALGVFEYVTNGVRNTASCVSDPAECAKQAEKEFNRRKAELEKAVEEAIEKAAPIIQKAARFLEERLAEIEDAYLRVVSPLNDAITQITEVFADKITALGNKLSQAFDEAEALYEQLATAAEETYANGLKIAKTTAAPLFDAVEDKIGTAIDAIAPPAQQIREELEGLTNGNPFGTITEIVTNNTIISSIVALDTLGGIAEQLVPAISDLQNGAGKFADWSKETGGKLSDWTKDAGGKVADWTKDRIDDLLEQEITAYQVCSNLDFSLNLLNGSVYLRAQFGPGLEYDVRKFGDLLSGRLTLPNIDPVKALSTYYGAVLSVTTNYEQVRAEQYEQFGPQNVYFASRRFVEYAGTETVAETVAKLIASGGGSAEDDLAELAEQLRLELNDILAWLEIKGKEQLDQFVSGLIQSIFHRTDFVTPHIELRWTPVTYRYELEDVPFIGKAVEAISGEEADLSDLIGGRELATNLQHAGFAIIWKIPDVEDPLNPQSIDAALDGYLDLFDQQQFSSPSISTDLLDLALSQLGDLNVPDDLLRLVSTMRSGSIEAIDWEQELSDRFERQLGLDEGQLMQVAEAGKMVLDLGSTPAADRLTDLLDDIALGNRGHASLDLMEFNLSTFTLTVSASLCHEQSWGSISSIFGLDD